MVSPIGYKASSEAFVFKEIMQERTIIYIDGFNLYYGSLKNTPYKWLNLKTLFSKILGNQHHITELKYFTARVSGKNGDIKAPLRQKLYLSALEKYIPELKIYYGHYLTNSVVAKLCQPKHNQPAFAKVFKTEEKGSDVNLALHILNDAWLNNYDCAVLVSNDSDLAEALRLVNNDHKKKIGLIVPGDEKVRRPSKELVQYATFIKRIRHSVLAESQLPNRIPNTQLYKPETW
jgi:uncharacterized LabA/DUF88 family protein